MTSNHWTILFALIPIIGTLQAQTVTTYDSRTTGTPVASQYRAVDIADLDANRNPDAASWMRSIAAPALIDVDTRSMARITSTVEQAKADLDRAIADIPPTPEQMLMRRIATTMVLQNDLSADEIEMLVEIYPPWAVGRTYATNQMVRFEGQLYRVVQAHTSQADWTPPVVQALFVKVAAPGAIEPWVQPQGAHDAYNIGDRVTHNGFTWISTVANNVWEPGVYGWNQE
jgi:hypothetical protein